MAGGVVMHEYALAPDADVTDMAVVKSINPARRISVESLTTKFDSPTMTLAHWKRFVCNIATRGGKSAITEAEWEAAKVDEGIPKGQPIAIGLDVAWKWDTTSAVPFWMKEPTDRLFGPALVITPPRDGSSLHPDEIKSGLKELHSRNPIHTVVMDLSRAEDLAAWIEDELGAEVIDWPQSNTQYVANYDAFMEALRNGWLHHTGDEGLTKHALNAIARMLPGGDNRFDRPVEGRLADQERRVIDALDAASFVNAHYAVPVAEAPEPFVLFGGGR